MNSDPAIKATSKHTISSPSVKADRSQSQRPADLVRSANAKAADTRTASTMARELVRLAKAGPVEAHQLLEVGFTRDQVQRLGARAIEIAARLQPASHHPLNSIPHHQPAHAVRASGRFHQARRL